MNVQVNYVALLVASVVSMALGFLWYSTLFGKPWTRLMGYTKESMEKAKQGMVTTYTVSYVATLLMGYMLAHVMQLSMNFFHYPALQTGLTTGFFMWLGFVAPVQLSDALFGKRNWTLYAINTGYQLASLLAMGVVFGLMG